MEDNRPTYPWFTGYGHPADAQMRPIIIFGPALSEADIPSLRAAAPFRIVNLHLVRNTRNRRVSVYFIGEIDPPPFKFFKMHLQSYFFDKYRMTRRVTLNV